MQIADESEDTLVLVYQPWFIHPAKRAIPLYLLCEFGVLILAVIGVFPYPWLVAFVAAWAIGATMFMMRDIFKDVWWIFDKKNQLVTHEIKRPAQYAALASTFCVCGEAI
jgi:hypothetical protein